MLRSKAVIACQVRYFRAGSEIGRSRVAVFCQLQTRQLFHVNSLVARPSSLGHHYFSNDTRSASVGALLAGLAVAAGCTLTAAQEAEQDGVDDAGTEIENWSSTHSVKTKAYLQPESLEEVERIVADAHGAGTRIRVVGSALSPNGVGLSTDTMLSLGQCDRIINVDRMRRTVTVEAGARVQQVVDSLAPYGLTLQNYASISEQQLGGFLQVGAHGTGASIPPVDEQVVAMKIVTPTLGTLELSERQNPALFRMAKVGQGALGVVTEVTIKCVRRHQLLEKTSVMTRAEVKAKHHALLQNNKHVRYMWIPYTDAVVVVRCNPLGLNDALLRRQTQPPPNLVTCAGKPDKIHPQDQQVEDATRCLKPLKELLVKRAGSSLSAAGMEEIESMNFADLRDKLLAFGALDVEWVKKVNEAEAEFWRRSQGTRVDYSDRILGFECGGQQWVNEVCFPTGTLQEPNDKDLDYMTELLSLIEKKGVAAPAPIEQRWTASSSAKMSPAHDPSLNSVLTRCLMMVPHVFLYRTKIFSWVGVIMYLPPEDTDARQRITDAFFAYRDLCEEHLWDRYGCVVHWAKLEKPRSADRATRSIARLRRRFPVSEFNGLRKLFDPKNILANDHINVCLGEVGQEAMAVRDAAKEVSRA